MLNTISHRPEEGCVLCSALLLRHDEASGGVSRKCHEPSPVTQMLAPLCHAVTDSLSRLTGAADSCPRVSVSVSLRCSALAQLTSACHCFLISELGSYRLPECIFSSH